MFLLLLILDLIYVYNFLLMFVYFFNMLKVNYRIFGEVSISFDKANNLKHETTLIREFGKKHSILTNFQTHKTN